MKNRSNEWKIPVLRVSCNKKCWDDFSFNFCWSPIVFHRHPIIAMFYRRIGGFGWICGYIQIFRYSPLSCIHCCRTYRKVFIYSKFYKVHWMQLNWKKKVGNILLWSSTPSLVKQTPTSILFYVTYSCYFSGGRGVSF